MQAQSIAGTHIIEPKRFQDERGYFWVQWMADGITALGSNARFVQSNMAFNHKAGTLRGMHAQTEPYQEDKLITCIQGAIFDVIVDIRPDSPTYCQWFGIELSEENARSFYLPKGCLHGYQALTDNTKVLYQVTAPYRPLNALGARYDDPAFGIEWPLPVSVLSKQDEGWPPFA